MHIGVAGPLSTKDLRGLLDGTSTFVSEMQGSSFLATYIKELIRGGHQVSAFTTEPSLHPGERYQVHSGPNFRLHCVPMRRKGFRSDRRHRGRMLDLFALERQELVDAMRAAAPAVVHAHWSYEYAWAGIDSGVPTLVTCHDAPVTVLRVMRDAYRLGRLLMAWNVLRRATHLSSVSPYLNAELRQLGARLDPVIIPNPVAHEAFAHVPHAWSTRIQDAPSIMMILNGWSPIKNAAVGMQALAQIKMARPQAILRLIGPDFGPGGAASQYAREHGIGHLFEFLGPQNHADVITLLKQADLLVHPSVEESFGMTIAEAMACGLPVVAGRTSGAIPWVTGQGRAGRLVDIRSVDDIRQGCMDLLDSRTSYEMASAFGREHARLHFTPASVTRAYLDLIEQILENQPVGLARHSGAT